ncbi:DUF6517 family protein [Natronococcus wangiae]|uniref:DUF6517 family protein n=1 Tax=Natronococcus wangiae TaxID=3068275 RepID=UPI00273DAB8A|nr:DUF6517 family protein [Natronococcus sp. AD5]
MTFTRRYILATGAAVGTGLGAGCTRLAEDRLSSTPAVVDDEALAETGYGEYAVDELVIERTVGRFGLKRTLEVRNWYAEYDRAIPLDAIGLTRLQAAVVAVLSTPRVSAFGRSFNPVGEYTTDELVELIQDRYDELEVVERVGETSVPILGTETTVAWYDARARLVEVGSTLDVAVQVSEAVEHGDDFVLCVAVYPRVGGLETESDAVRTLMAGIEHEQE